MDGRDAMRSSYPLKADVGATADSWYLSSPITEGCRRDARLGKEQDGHLPVEMGVGRHRENEKPNSTLAKGWLQTAGTLKVESHCAELTKGFLEAEAAKLMLKEEDSGRMPQGTGVTCAKAQWWERASGFRGNKSSL